MSEQPVVINIQYTPYEPSGNMTKDEIAKHAENRAYYNLTGDKNYYKYMTTEEKCAGGYNVLDYFQKTTGVFNDKGIISEQALAEMKIRAKENKGNIWHGYISFHEEETYKVNTPEKCIAFVKANFGKFLRDAGFRKDTIDLICSLHTDRPNHFHIHFCFWEKGPTQKVAGGIKEYRRKGRIRQSAIDNLMVKSEVYLCEERQSLYHTRVEAIKALRGMTYVKKAMSKDEIKKEIIALAKELPKEGRLSYGSKDMEPYRERVDRIVQMMLSNDKDAKASDDKFYASLQELKKKVNYICTKPFLLGNNNLSPSELENEPEKHRHKIDESKITIIEEIEKDYVRRQGNLVINLAKFVKPEYYESKGKKANSNKVKHYGAVSNRKMRSLISRFFQSFTESSRWLERDYSNRLQEIEQELKEEEKKQKQKEENSKG